MNLRSKKQLAARTFNVGMGRILFAESRLDEIKDAITKQDIKDLKEQGAIKIKPIKGTKKIVKRKNQRGPGKIRKKLKKRKEKYVTLTRKLRNYLNFQIKEGLLNKEDAKILRNKIKNKDFKTQSQLKEHLGGKK